ncbi:MAG: pyrimidine dimer DNA glycosylase/endonuclease V [Dehalococcoidia bacterium]
MRIWDVPCERLSRSHLLGEHRELHALWNILRRIEDGESRVGYARHPETLRWLGHGEALRLRHDEQAAEMARRGWQHHSPLEGSLRGVAGWPDVRLPGSVPLYLREA